MASFKSAFTSTTTEELKLNALNMEGVDLDLYMAMFKLSASARKADLNLNSTKYLPAKTTDDG